MHGLADEGHSAIALQFAAASVAPVGAKKASGLVWCTLLLTGGTKRGELLQCCSIAWVFERAVKLAMLYADGKALSFKQAGTGRATGQQDAVQPHSVCGACGGGCGLQAA